MTATPTPQWCPIARVLCLCAPRCDDELTDDYAEPQAPAVTGNARPTSDGTEQPAASAPLKAGDDCPRCHGELMQAIHNYQEDGGAPDCCWLYCLDCNFETEPE